MIAALAALCLIFGLSEQALQVRRIARMAQQFREQQ